MKVKNLETEFEGEKIGITAITFGQSVYLYVGGKDRTFDDLTLTMPNTLDSTHLLGDKPTNDLGVMASEIIGWPVLASYAFSLESDVDLARYEHVRMFLTKSLKENCL